MRLADWRAGLADVVRFGLSLVVVEDQAEIRAAEHQSGRIPVDRRRVVGHGDEGAAHAGRPGAQHLEALSGRRMRTRS